MSKVTERRIPHEYLAEEMLLGEFLTPEVARLLIAEHASIYNLLLHTTEQQWASVTGMGKAKMKRLAYIKAIFKRVEEERKRQIPIISSPEDVAAFCADMQDLQQEEFRVVFLNTKNKIIGCKTIFTGTIDAAIVSGREIFCAAVKHMAAHIVVVHNHPSGNPVPSQEDIVCTRQLMKAGNLLNIKILDHVIIGRCTYYSFKEKGQMSAETTNDDI